MAKSTFNERLNKIKSKVHKSKDMQIGNVRFDKETYDKISAIAKDLDVTKQWLIQQIIRDFLIQD